MWPGSASKGRGVLSPGPALGQRGDQAKTG